MVFKNRQSAGKLLAANQLYYLISEKPIVLALPRGGVPVGFEVAKKLNSPLDVFLVKKIGAPFDPELGIGAVAEGNIQILDKKLINELGISKDLLSKSIKKSKEKLEEKIAIYRENPLLSLKNKTVILVDDGVATGVTARAAIEGIKKLKPKKIIFASPVCALDTARDFKSLVNDVICLTTPPNLASIGSWYEDFEQIEDEDVIKMLKTLKN